MLKKCMILGIVGGLFALMCAVNTCHADGCIPPSSGLVGWWPGDGDANDIIDLTDLNDGTLLNGATFAAGKVGQALSLDGVNDFVRVVGNSTLEPATITVEAWVRSSDPGGAYTYILAKGARECVRASYALWVPPSGGGLQFYISEGDKAAVKSPRASQAAVWDGNWHHVVGTYDGSKVRLYMDGVEIGSGTPTTIDIGYGEVMTTNNNLSIGRYDGSCALSYTGLIDELSIYNRALSASEIQAIFNAGSAGKCLPECTTPPSDLVSWWTGDGDADDIQDANDGALMNGATFAAGRVGEAFSFDGVDDYILVPDAPNLDIPGNLTVDAWVKLDVLRPSGIHNIVSKERTAVPLDVNYNLHIYGNRVFFALTFDASASLNTANLGTGGCDAGGCFVWGATSLTTGDIGVFVHVAGVYDDTEKKMTVYLNAVKDGEATFSTIGKPKTNDEPVRLSKRNYQSGTGTHLDGVIDEVEIYDRALSASEIQDIYDAGSAGKCKCAGLAVDAGFDQTVYYGYGPECAALSAMASGGTEPYSYLWSTDETTQEIEVWPDNTTNYTVTVTDANGCTATDEVTVNVINARCGKNDNKVLVCHVPPGNPENKHDICISPNAVPTHLAHGDFLGSCDNSGGQSAGAGSLIPLVFDLLQNNPNPFARETSISYMLPASGHTTLKIYDASGRVVETLVDTELSPGIYSVNWDRRDTASGVYFYRLSSNGKTLTRKMTVVR